MIKQNKYHSFHDLTEILQKPLKNLPGNTPNENLKEKYPIKNLIKKRVIYLFYSRTFLIVCIRFGFCHFHRMRYKPLFYGTEFQIVCRETRPVVFLSSQASCVLPLVDPLVWHCRDYYLLPVSSTLTRQEGTSGNKNTALAQKQWQGNHATASIIFCFSFSYHGDLLVIPLGNRLFWGEGWTADSYH